LALIETLLKIAGTSDSIWSIDVNGNSVSVNESIREAARCLGACETVINMLHTGWNLAEQRVIELKAKVPSENSLVLDDADTPSTLRTLLEAINELPGVRQRIEDYMRGQCFDNPDEDIDLLRQVVLS